MIATQARIARLGAALMVGVAASSCEPAEAVSEANLGKAVVTYRIDSASEILHEHYSGLGDSTRSVVSDSDRWRAVWTQVQRGSEPKLSLPAVDFAQEEVLVVALGTRSSGGYDIRVDSAVTREHGVVVYVTRSAPGEGCVMTDAFTQPVQIVRVPRGPPATLFQESAVVRIPCA